MGGHTPYLPHYQYHLEQYNCEHNPFPTPPLQTRFTHGLTPTPNLSLLAEVCNIQWQLAHLKEEHEAPEHNKECTHKIPPPLITPIFRLTPAKTPQEPPSWFTLLTSNGISGQLVDKSTYTPSPPPSLTSPSHSTLIENEDVTSSTGIHLGSDTDNDLDSVSSDASEDSNYPLLYYNPMSYPLL